MTKFMKEMLIKARLHLNSMYTQQEKSSRLAEVSSSVFPADLSRKIEETSARRVAKDSLKKILTFISFMFENGINTYNKNNHSFSLVRSC